MKKLLKLVVKVVLFVAVLGALSDVYFALTDDYDTDTELSTNCEDGVCEVGEAEKENTEIQEISDFTVVDGNKESVSLSSLTGKPIVVNFWASWCSPCKNELPDFQEAYEKYGSEVEFVMVNMTDGSSETFGSAKQFITSKGYTFPVYYDINQDAASTYSVNSIPATYFMDENGGIVTSVEGMVDVDTLEEGIDMIR